MPTIVLRNLPAETHRALKLRAKLNGRSIEAEISSILEDAVRPAGRLKIGSELAAFKDELGGSEIEFRRDLTPINPASFE
ncbi:FitA-like ribbon-helix-helix domain-containing protein [Rhizobium sp. 21-4511-3d]